MSPKHKTPVWAQVKEAWAKDLIYRTPKNFEQGKRDLIFVTLSSWTGTFEVKAKGRDNELERPE